jgi:hypothetical protein
VSEPKTPAPEDAGGDERKRLALVTGDVYRFRWKKRNGDEVTLEGELVAFAKADVAIVRLSNGRERKVPIAWFFV